MREPIATTLASLHGATAPLTTPLATQHVALHFKLLAVISLVCALTVTATCIFKFHKRLCICVSSLCVCVCVCIRCLVCLFGVS